MMVNLRTTKLIRRTTVQKTFEDQNHRYKRAFRRADDLNTPFFISAVHERTGRVEKLR